MDVSQISNEFKNEVNELKKMDKGSFFNFDKLYFPTVARYIFIIICIVLAVLGVVGVIGSLVVLFSGKIIGGLLGVFFPSSMSSSRLF